MRFLITTPVDNKHQAARPQRGTSLKIIAQHFSMTCGRLVTGEQCMRKWGKLTSKQKEIEDHNNKSWNEKKSWKFYEELSECLAKDATVTPVCTMESNVQENDHNSITCNTNSQQQSDDVSFSESVAGETCSDSSGKRSKANTSRKRCRKIARSRSSAAEMLEFLHSYSKSARKLKKKSSRF